jgi:hypothetical protein
MAARLQPKLSLSEKQSLAAPSLIAPGKLHPQLCQLPHQYAAFPLARHPQRWAQRAFVRQLRSRFREERSRIPQKLLPPHLARGTTAPRLQPKLSLSEKKSSAEPSSIAPAKRHPQWRQLRH